MNYHFKLIDGPMGKRERQILQLAMAGNTAKLIDQVLNLVDGEANRVCEKFEVEPRQETTNAVNG